MLKNSRQEGLSPSALCPAHPILFFLPAVGGGRGGTVLPDLLELKSFILGVGGVMATFSCATFSVLPLLGTAPGLLDPQQALLWPVWADEARTSQHPASQPGPSHRPGH